MEQVAREARLSRGLLYIYFRDRTDLHLGLCERALAMLHERSSRRGEQNARGVDKLTAMGRAYVDFSRECPVYFEALARFQASDASADETDGNLPACLQAGACVHEFMTRTLEARHARRLDLEDGRRAEHRGDLALGADARRHPDRAPERRACSRARRDRGELSSSRPLRMATVALARS